MAYNRTMANSTTYSILEPNGTLQARSCAHCGETLTPSNTVESEGRHFCCTGCSSVHELLNTLGLGDFYKIKEAQDNAKLEPAMGADSGESYDYLNQSNFIEIYTKKDDPLSMNFYIEGIHCAACLWLLEKVPEFCSGIASVSLNMTDNTAAVRFNEPAHYSIFPETVRRLGYKAHALKTGGEEHINELKRKESRTALIRLAVAAVCAGNIMLLSAAIYSGAGGAFAKYFGLLNLLLTIPVVTYCTYPFYKSVWSSLLIKRATVDIPVVFVILAGFSLSVYSYFKATGEVYFDSITAFAFLLLASRYFLKIIQDRVAASEPLREGIFNSNRVLILDNDTRDYSLMPIEHLSAGQVIKLKKGERIPADGELLSTVAEVNLSVLTGENIPLKVLKHTQVYAGSVLESDEAIIRLLKTGNNSRIGQILDTVNRNYKSRFNVSTGSDRFATVFTLIVGTIAITSFFALSSLFTPGEALRRVIAFVLIACPCAFVFALPLALGVSIKSGIKKGRIIKDSSIFDKLPDIENIYFDKTGTLTKGVFRILKWDTDSLTTQDKAAILAIEKHSNHPVARAVINYLADDELPALKAEDFRIIPSRGVEATVNNSSYTLFSESIEQNNDINAVISTKIIINKDGEPISLIFLGDSLKEDAKYVVDELQKRGKSVFILSGDRESSVKLTGRKLNIPENNVFWEKTPEEKSEIIMGTEASALQRCPQDKIKKTEASALQRCPQDKIKQTEAILRQAQDDRVLNCDTGAGIKYGDGPEHVVYAIGGNKLRRQRRAPHSDAGADKIKKWGRRRAPRSDAGADKIKGLSMMIGDGLNDAAALSSADIGIAIQGSVEESMKVSDAYILNNDLYSILGLLNQGKAVSNTLFRNSIFSILYNVAAGTLALLGYISPLVAAVLMPLSSLLLIGSTMYGQQNPTLKELKARL